MSHLRVRDYTTRDGKSYRVVIVENRKERTLATGIRSKRKAEALRRELEELHRERAAGVHKPTVGDLVEDYVARLEAKGKVSAKDVRATTSKWIDVDFRARLVEDLQVADVDDLLEQIEGASSASTANHQRAYLSAAFTLAAKKGVWRGANLGALSDKRQGVRKVPVILTVDEVDALIDCPHGLRTHYRLLAGAQFETARRLGELAAAQKVDVDLDNRQWRVCRSWERDQTKTGQETTVPLSTRACWFFAYAMLRSPSDHVFTDAQGQPFKVDTNWVSRLRSGLRRAGVAVTAWNHRCRWCKRDQAAGDGEQRECESCGRQLWALPTVRPVTWKALRHARITHLYNIGLDWRAVKAIAGHHDRSRIAETHYLVLGPEALERMMDKRERTKPETAGRQYADSVVDIRPLKAGGQK